MDFESKIKEMGYEIEPVELDNGIIIMAVKSGNLVFTSGQVPTWDDVVIKGKVGGDLTLEQGYEAAKLCTLNNLRAIKTIAGSLNNDGGLTG